MDRHFSTTLQQAVKYFADYENCHDFMVSLRWPDGIVRCPQCGSDRVTYLEKARRFKCYGRHPMAKFTLKTGTIFEDSPIGLDKWIVAMWFVVNCKNEVSSYEIARAIGVTQKTAWFMDHRIRFALHEGSFETKIGGEGSTVEVDEAYIGGLARNMHKSKRVQGRTGSTFRLGNHCHRRRT
jgi:transposase-like protein